MPTTKPLAAYVDIDDTLVRSFGSKRIPMTEVVAHVRALHRDGALLYRGAAPEASTPARRR